MKIKLSKELKSPLKSLKRKWLAPIIQLTAGLTLEMQVLNTFFELRGNRPPPEDVVIVSIDDRGYKILEASTNYPLPRREIATAIEAIALVSPRPLIPAAKILAER